jgi:hypothetical protein
MLGLAWPRHFGPRCTCSKSAAKLLVQVETSVPPSSRREAPTGPVSKAPEAYNMIWTIFRSLSSQFSALYSNGVTRH